MNSTDKPKSPSIAIIYHQYCADGIVAAAICGMTQQIINDKKAYGPDANWMEENIVFLPASYKKPMPKLPETVNKVYVVDFSFGIKEVNKVIEESQRVIWFSITDHHETSMKAYCDCKYLHRTHNSEEGYDFFMPIESSVAAKSPYLLPTYFTALIDQSKSAALLCYEEFAREYQARFKHPPTEDNIIEYVARRISDRDLWNFVYPETRAIYEMLISFIDYHKKNAPLDIVRFFDEKSKGGGLLESQMYIEANARVEMRLQIAKEYASKSKVIDFEGMKAALVNVPSNFSSEAGDVLGKDHDFAIMYVVGDNDQVFFSLRSNKETGANVEVIAEQHFNGGGHVNAAGGFGTLETLRKLYNLQAKEQKSKTIFGIPITSEFMTLAEAVYPNDQDGPFEQYGELAIEIAMLSLKMRYEAAVSGAMRWRWSQEAPIGGKAYYALDYENFEQGVRLNG